MAGVRTIPVKIDTKKRYDELREGRMHDQFIQELIRVWSALTPAERYRLMAQSFEKSAAQKGA